MMSSLKSWRMQDDDWDPYRADKRRLVETMNAHGYACTLEQAEQLWTRYSESMAAGWMHMPEDEDPFWTIAHYIEEDE